MDKRKIALVSKPISIKTLKSYLGLYFDDFIKGVVDIKNNIMAINAELHADQEQFLLEHGCKQEDLRGINLYPDSYPQKHRIEFDSMINIRPSVGNRSRSVQDLDIQKKIITTVNLLIKPEGGK